MATRQPDAIRLLTQQHGDVKKMFKAYEKMKETAQDDEKQALASRICKELTLHTQIEEEIFYPAVREGIDDEDLMDEAEVEHASAKDLISQIESGSPSDELYDAKVKVLGEYVNHHVEEEEGEMFPEAREAIDPKEIGRQLDERATELRSQLGITDPPPMPVKTASTRTASTKAASKKAASKKVVAKKAPARGR